MTKPLPQLVKERLEFSEERDGIAIVKAAEQNNAEYFTPKTEWTVWGEKEECREHGFYAGARCQRERTAPLTALLVECVEALEQLQAEIDRSKKECLCCANGHDLQDYDICRGCWRVYINGEKYLIWDWKTTEARLQVLNKIRKEVE